MANHITGYLPAPLSTFIGREHEAAEVRQLLSAHRLVISIRPGGFRKIHLEIMRAKNEKES